MTKAAAFTKAAIKRAMEAVKAGGETVSAVEIRPDGSILVLTGAAPVPLVAADPYEEWKSGRGHRAA